ncbi:GNAT superfamily N-acetyltransferase [Geomicrobium halophilum]|uniref:GNAT superfamily N-acetyltransferase n=1 Tax=Geomicrobium halophilum TaxID=549000 RepID=A0A841Q2Q2_9BACL|nr:GNAT family N-acetyltransferase [Geomicrobium halophilum]MBB6451098.1 GNAT superfamily N-acetyltransferase [Geomicrobium halophilum]
MQSTFTLRTASASDKERLATLRMKVMAPDFERHGLESERVQEYFNKKFDPSLTYIIESEDIFVGCISVKPEDNGHHIEHFYIKPEYQGKGFGSNVLKHIMDENYAKGEVLSLAVFKGSASKAFYEKYGFEVVDEESFVDWLRFTYK